jgi:hypothetical protein
MRTKTVRTADAQRLAFQRLHYDEGVGLVLFNFVDKVSWRE